MPHGLEALDNEIRELLDRQEKEESKRAGMSVKKFRARKKKVAEASRKEEELQAAKERQRLIERDNERRQAYGESLGLGAPAYIGHIMTRGGLSERGMGNGMDRNTVWHIVMSGDMVSGRLRRTAGDLLCRKASSLGSRTMGLSEDQNGGSMDEHRSQQDVTCSKCLEILERIQKRNRSQ